MHHRGESLTRTELLRHGKRLYSTLRSMRTVHYFVFIDFLIKGCKGIKDQVGGR
jgi:hypothetical protein